MPKSYPLSEDAADAQRKIFLARKTLGPTTNSGQILYFFCALAASYLGILIEGPLFLPLTI